MLRSVLAFLRNYGEWILVVPMYGYAFSLQQRYDRPTAAAGLMWFGAVLATLVVRWVASLLRSYSERRRLNAATLLLTPGSAIPPVMMQMNIQATRADKAVRTEYPDDVEQVIFFGGYDGKVDQLEVGVFLKGSMARKLAVPFPGDPAGAWMFTDTEREKMLRMRSIVWSYAMAIGDMRFQPPVIFDSGERLQEVIRNASSAASAASIPERP